MFHWLELIFVRPIEWVIELCLVQGFRLTESYGLAIIFVSLVVSTMLIPAFRYAEYLMRRERDIQDKLKPELDRLKAEFRGYELYERIDGVYKAHHYHPIYAARASLGVMIQIPFFIAAYHFLATFEPFRGQAFFLLPDLGQPDAMLGLGSMRVNLLPVVMTAVNLINAKMMGRGRPWQEQVPVFLVAVMFFVLLYSAPAGLLLYWTSNNTYSLVRTLFGMRKNKLKAASGLKTE